MKQPCIYILASQRNGTLYVGVTSNLVQRISQHKENVIEGFTSKYNCKILVYYEPYEDMQNAIAREKQLKAGSRKRKLEIIENSNPEWKDLFENLL